ncbi:putative ESCRT-II complex, Vps25 subunit, winged helix DNA-binding domain superfamily [Helianthus annuus]|nr:putative ESCRT-II complex, Vps25 subunit, winged helix DNA-binding domain superfamily [Helianthus annuus]KAJ0472780.1 putative ESCRT-II complex, Vps25 subunit, winged helix DNA-binding domain superfamily [Helianthus annuus]KAJ0648385.1 putative ESCRT-II complex, Vps25 subunit, winged helix DNA-binding domain superfamily [Helianthus annuus]KAJ0652214.1 putative ESCRT-II complex, Vps25 subunit, winged helix DNA-binding domain superfamily [Helianthus annuus]
MPGGQMEDFNYSNATGQNGDTIPAFGCFFIHIPYVVIYTLISDSGVTGSDLVTLIRLQPVRETQEKQIQLWKELIIAYCRMQKLFIIGLEEDFPLFSNPAIESDHCFLLDSTSRLIICFTKPFALIRNGSLNYDARSAFLSALVSDGRAEWTDKGHRQCLILWHQIQEWADIILRFVSNMQPHCVVPPTSGDAAFLI